jgi:ABC-type multidrug transport system fused ATPase/permease subunit
MTILAEILAFSLFAFWLVFFAIQWAAQALGAWLGRRHTARGTAPAEGVGVVVGGMLGLLAFVLALTLSFATTRFEERRQGTLMEANALGTAWLRAKAIGHPRGEELAKLFEDYTRLRADFIKAPASRDAVRAINDKTSELQNRIWEHVTVIVRERPDAISSSLMAATNEVFDRSTAERFAFAQTMPAQMVWLLMGIAVLSIGALGYQLGLRKLSLPILSVLLIGMWTSVIVVILDLSAPRIGSLRSSAAAYYWTLDGFNPGTVPARP